MNNTRLLFALAFTCLAHLSYSMSIPKIARTLFFKKTIRISPIRRITTDANNKEWGQEILRNNRLREIYTNIHQEEAIIANQGREGDIFSKMDENARLYNLVRARERKQKLEKEAFNIQMKLAEKK